LIEFLIVLFFFLIISTVCLRLFVQSWQITRRANALSGAQAAAASITAVLSAHPDSADAMDLYFPDARMTEDGFQLDYDSKFQVISNTDSSDSDSDPSADADSSDTDVSGTAASYTLTAHFSGTQDILAEISVCDRTGDVLYTFSATVHRPLTRKEALQ
jgi:hypothetical protein